MAKYYIKSGTFGTILDAPDISSGVQRAAYRAAKDSASVGVLVTVSETGFSLGTSSKIISFIPFYPARFSMSVPGQCLCFRL